MLQRNGVMLVTVALAAVLMPHAAHAMVGIGDIAFMVEKADLIVRAKVVRTEEREFESPLVPHDKYKFEIKVLEVQKALVGKCGPTILFDLYGGTGGDTSGFAVGDEYLLCLEPSDERKGTWREVNFGHTKILVKDGRAVFPERLTVPDHFKWLLADRAIEKVESAILYLRGPALAVRATRDVFACDEPLELEATWTNTTPLPMKIRIGEGKAAAYGFQLRLSDERDFDVLREMKGGVDEKGEWPGGDEARHAETLAPGQSVSRTFRFYLRLDDFAEDPEIARTVCVSSWPGWSEGFWVGRLMAQCPVRLTCPYRSWAAELRRPAGDWAVSLSTNVFGEPTVMTVVSGRAAWIDVAIRRYVARRPVAQRDKWNDFSMNVVDLTPDDRKALAACLRVERDGKPVPCLAAQGPELPKFLAALPADEAAFVAQHFNVGEFFDLKAPGTYHVRLALPTAPAPSLSNILTVRVPAAEGKDTAK